MHKLVKLQEIIEQRIGSLREEVEVATNIKLNALYVTDLKDETASLQRTTRLINWILDQTLDGQQRLGVTRQRLELEDEKKFIDMLHDRIQVLEIELDDSNSDREKEIIVNQIDTLKCVLGHLFNLKCDEKVRAVEITESNDNSQQVKRLKKKLIMVQDKLSKLHK
jgi:hypothetical protein